ncbi:MAG: flagellar hook-length control protein FliK [Proteobacteria bacterium]|nr:flagellar hook-length control protein FliK [Pseudomonadota bacterium]
MALNIRPSSASSSSTSSTQSSSAKTSVPDLFAQGMAAAAKSAQKSTPHKAPQPKHTSTAPKPATKTASAPKPKPTPKLDADDSQSKATAKSASAAGKPKPAAPQPAQNDHATDGTATAEANAAEANADSANGVKGRATARTTGKNAAPQNAAASTKARETAADPSADETNQSGLSLLQLLAQSLGDADSEAPSTDTAAAPAATDKSSTDATDKAGDDPNAIALAMFSQALAAALAGQQTPGATAAGKDDGTAAIGDATRSPGGAASTQDIMTVLAHDIAASAQGKSDDAAAQFNVDPTKLGADSNSDADPTLAPNALTNSLAHLGVASHFAAQHPRNDTNPGELRAPVGSSDWNDELGAHLTWMTQKGLETGSLRVSPEHLGPVEVNISVQNGAASVWFAANHADTRAALEQALPRLREMFASQGMNLADSGVSRQSVADQGSRDRGRSGASQSVSGVAAVAGTEGASATASRINLGLVDLYA